jgi:hypothetical protein
MALVEHGYSNPSSILPCILGYALWSYLYHILIISRGLHEFKSIFTKKFPEKNFHAKRLHMNERIQKLAEQAGILIDWGEDIKVGRWGIGGKYENMQKFAELILHDVMSICEDLGDKGMDGHYCVDKIRKEFGV